MSNIIEIAEIYPAHQCEGRFLGRQSLFVRVHKCPLKCSWCDTKFTWDKTDPDYGKNVAKLSPQELVWRIENATKDHEPQAIVFTGGEPMVYQSQIAETIKRYSPHHRAMQYEMETSGIIAPTEISRGDIHFNVSHKLPSAGNDHVTHDKLFNSDATKVFAHHPGIFKVVVAPEDEETSLPLYLDWLRITLEDELDWAELRRRIYLMPEGIDGKHVVNRMPTIFSLAHHYGVNATTRLHIIAYGNKRGR